MKNLSLYNLFFRDLKKTKQIGKQLRGGKTKTAPNNPADSL